MRKEVVIDYISTTHIIADALTKGWHCMLLSHGNSL
jgi:hypothetical protein